MSLAEPNEIPTDRRNPTVNAYGKIYWSPELSADDVAILDSVKNTKTTVKLPVRDPNTPTPQYTEYSERSDPRPLALLGQSADLERPGQYP